MRRIWIKRRKAAAASMAAMKVYIEDPENGDVTINGIRCRKLGLLKNGRKVHYNIEEDALKVFVISGKISRKVEYDFAQLPEGRDDIVLSGKNIFKPFNGNPFLFDETEGEVTIVNHKLPSRAGTALLVIAILLGIGGGIFAGVMLSNKLMPSAETPAAAAKVFAAEDLEITLNDQFAPANVAGFTASYGNGEAAVYVLREDFASFEQGEDLTVADYGAMVLKNNGLTDVTQLTEEGTFEYRFTQKETGASYYYYCVVRKGADAFWLVQFAVPARVQEQYASQFPQWAQSIVLEN